MASEQTIKYIKDAEGNLLKIDYDALANKPIIEQAKFVIGEEGTEDEGILSIEGTQGGNFSGSDGEPVNLSDYAKTSYVNAQIDLLREADADLTANILNFINNLHYYGNKDIIPSYQGITITSLGTNDDINIDGSLCLNGTLIIPYDYVITNSLSYPNYNITNAELITKIIIPRNADVDFYYEDQFAEGIRHTWSDETFLEHFPNLEVLVRIHEDGAVLSYNLKTEALN